MGADYSFYVKTIETHARAFLTLNILAIGRVMGFVCRCTLFWGFNLQFRFFNSDLVKEFLLHSTYSTLLMAEILSGKNARAWV